MKQKVVAIINRSAGNESVGDMWKETKIFDLDTPVEKILLWAGGNYLPSKTTNVLLTITEVED